jgi:hypothetical protein
MARAIRCFGSLVVGVTKLIWTSITGKEVTQVPCGGKKKGKRGK